MVSEYRDRSANPYKCDRCGRTYTAKRSLALHLTTDCGIDGSLPCPQCGCRFKQKCGLKLHLIEMHKVESSQLAAFGLGISNFITSISPFIKFLKFEQVPWLAWFAQQINSSVIGADQSTSIGLPCIITWPRNVGKNHNWDTDAVQLSGEMRTASYTQHLLETLLTSNNCNSAAIICVAL